MNQYDKDLVNLLDPKVNISIMPVVGLKPHYIIETVNRLKRREDELINKSRRQGNLQSRQLKKYKVFNAGFTDFHKNKSITSRCFSYYVKIEIG